MSDYVSSEFEGDLMDPSFFELEGLDIPGWTGVEDDAAQARGGLRKARMVNTTAFPFTAGGEVDYHQHGLEHYATNDVLEVSAEAPTACKPHQTLVENTEFSTIAYQFAPSSLSQQLEDIDNISAITASEPDAQGECRLVEHHTATELDDTPIELPTAENATVRKKGKKRLALKCPISVCCYEGTFSRQYELDRHFRTKHKNDRTFECPYHGCLKGLNQSTFSRSDKLTQHIRSVHSRAIDKTIKCPAKDCPAPPLELGLLGVHIKKNLVSYIGHHYKNACRAIANAASSAFLICPLWHCRKQMQLQKFPEHLMTHDQDQLLSVEGELISTNYLLVREICYCRKVADSLDSMREACTCPVTNVQILCPVCKSAFWDHATCQDHIDEQHLVAEMDQLHFKTWRGICRENISAEATNDRLQPWKTWPITEPVDCSFCGFSERYHQYHPQMLTDSENIKPFRREILKLYPGFESHPVWEDLTYYKP